MNTSVVKFLLVTDHQRSVFTTINPPCPPQCFAYSAYGHQPALTNTIGFNGAPPESATGYYILGNGYRVFNPVLMRFNSPDYMSPFAEGGLNVYSYCLGDPVNCRDPSGHIPVGKILVDGSKKYIKHITMVSCIYLMMFCNLRVQKLL